MCAYNKVNGHYCSENKKLLTDILRNEWNYEGMVVSDWGAVHSIGKAVHAGMDFQMPENQNIYEELKTAYEKGFVSMEDIDCAIGRVVDFAVRIDEMRKKRKNEYNRAELHEIAKKASDESIVLLKNEGNILPIKPGKYRKLAVFGYYAEKPNILGGGGGSSGGVSVHDESISSALKYIRKNAGETEIIYEPLYNELSGSPDFPAMRRIQNILKEADSAIIFGGYPFYYEVEGEDRKTLHLPHYMERLLEETARFCENTIVVLQTGCAVAPYMDTAEPRAIVQMGYSGEAAGESIADILFGKVNPSGKLQCTYMNAFNSDIDLSGNGIMLDYKEKMIMGYRYYDNHPEKVWYPFGYGLSYTSFEYSDLCVKVQSEIPDFRVKVSFKIKNVGNCTGSETAQLYVSEREPSILRPFKELKGFEKVFLKPDEEKIVTLELDSSAFSYYNTNENDWHIESGIYDILVGKSAAEICLKDSVDIEWENDYTINRDRWKHNAITEFVGGE